MYLPLQPWAKSGFCITLLDVFATLHDGTFFIIGAWLAIHRDQVRVWAVALGRRRMVGLAILAAPLYTYPFDNPWNQVWRAMGDLLVGVGSALAFVLAMAAQGGSVLNLGRRLGKITHSMYLNHMLVLNAALGGTARLAGGDPLQRSAGVGPSAARGGACYRFFPEGVSPGCVAADCIGGLSCLSFALKVRVL